MDHVTLDYKAHHNNTNDNHTGDFFGNIKGILQNVENFGKPVFYNKGDRRQRSFLDDGRGWYILAMGKDHLDHVIESNQIFIPMTKDGNIYEYPCVQNMNVDQLIIALKTIYENHETFGDTTRNKFHNAFFISNHLVNDKHVIMIVTDHVNKNGFMKAVFTPLQELFGIEGLEYVTMNSILTKSINVLPASRDMSHLLNNNTRRDPGQWLVVKV
jgi:hypothetical protein